MTQPQIQEMDPPLPTRLLQPELSDPAVKILHKFHHHTTSDSNGSIGSNDSSPTTTISTVDDSSATEPSPGSSPESPPPNTFSVGMLRPRTADDSQKPFFRLEAPGPTKKGRNLKGLAVNTSRQPGSKASASTTSLSIQTQAHGDAAASIMSPSFIKPPTPKRKPNKLGLNIMTPITPKSPPQQIKLTIPPTPGLSRPGTLRHFQSSPSLPLVPSLGFHAPQLAIRPTLETISSPVDERPKPSQLALKEEDEEEQNFDIPQSREEKPEAYPDGPICVYAPLVDLYAEPTAEQCRQYDVVMNVASEVRNPLVVQNEPASVEPELVMDGGGGIRHHVPKHQTALNGSPTTPKATPLVTSFPKDTSQKTAKDPEYIHIKWEHNSDIVPDLLRLVKLIDDRVMHGKRILIHCQCGVSRSASLVVAYGLYKNPGMSVQEVYDLVKKKSRWIGPNMNLIMQLQEFRSSLVRGGVAFGNRTLSPIAPKSAVDEWRSPFSSSRSKLASENTPMSAIEPTRKEFTAESLPVLTSGPSSMPSGLPWPSILQAQQQEQPELKTQRARAISAVKPGSTYVDPSGHIVPVLQVVAPDITATKPSIIDVSFPLTKDESDSATPTEPLASPRSAHFAMTPLQPPEEADSADAFGLMSPSSTEMLSSPFDRTALLASLGMGSVNPQDTVPRRSASLTARNKQQESEDDSSSQTLKPKQRLRGKISSPSLREQQQLQSLQAKIEAKLSIQQHQPAAAAPALQDPDEALKSPRATEFTQNPFALSFGPHSSTSTAEDAPRTPQVDPRSPANKGVSPITRSIFDVL